MTVTLDQYLASRHYSAKLHMAAKFVCLGMSRTTTTFKSLIGTIKLKASQDSEGYEDMAEAVRIACVLAFFDVQDDSNMYLGLNQQTSDFTELNVVKDWDEVRWWTRISFRVRTFVRVALRVSVCLLEEYFYDRTLYYQFLEETGETPVTVVENLVKEPELQRGGSEFLAEITKLPSVTIPVECIPIDERKHTPSNVELTIAVADQPQNQFIKYGVMNKINDIANVVILSNGIEKINCVEYVGVSPIVPNGCQIKRYQHPNFRPPFNRQQLAVWLPIWSR
jgi:hypothetical protein